MENLKKKYFTFTSKRRIEISLHTIKVEIIKACERKKNLRDQKHYSTDNLNYYQGIIDSWMEFLSQLKDEGEIDKKDFEEFKEFLFNNYGDWSK